MQKKKEFYFELYTYIVLCIIDVDNWNFISNLTHIVLCIIDVDTNGQSLSINQSESK